MKHSPRPVRLAVALVAPLCVLIPLSAQTPATASNVSPATFCQALSAMDNATPILPAGASISEVASFTAALTNQATELKNLSSESPTASDAAAFTAAASHISVAEAYATQALSEYQLVNVKKVTASAGDKVINANLTLSFAAIKQETSALSPIAASVNAFCLTTSTQTNADRVALSVAFNAVAIAAGNGSPATYAYLKIAIAETPGPTAVSITTSDGYLVKAELKVPVSTLSVDVCVAFGAYVNAVPTITTC